MITVDYLLLTIFVLSTVIGLFRGVIKEAISLLGWVLALWGAWRFGADAAAWVPDFVGDGTARVWVARVLVLIGVLFITGLVSWVSSLVINKSGLSGTNRMVGMVFGLGRGIVFAGLAVYLLEVTSFDEEIWWSESKLIPYAAPVAERLRDIAAEGLDILDEPVDQLKSPEALP